MKIGDKIIIDINKFAYLGYGLAKKDGLTIFIPGGIPGDSVEGTITSLKKTYAFLKIDNIISPSPMRIKPECPVFNKCGGCDHLNLTYEKQVFFKEAILKEKIFRSFQEKPRFYPMEVSESREYRNKVELKYESSSNEIGFYSKRTNSIAQLPSGKDFCLIQPMQNQKIIDFTLEMMKESAKRKLKKLIIRNSFSTKENMIVAIGDFEFDENPFLFDDEKIKELGIVSINFVDRKNRLHNVFGNNYITEKVKEFEYKISPLVFFQTNTLIFEKMLNTLEQLLHITKDDIALDLYSGLGSFSLLLAKNAGKVYAIESNDNAVLLAKENAYENGIDNITFFTGKIRNRIKKIILEKTPSIALIDPPRKGMHYKAMEGLLEISPESIVYISCHLPSFIRDAQKLVENGYRFLAIYPFDMFPNTFYVEVMGYFTK